MKKNEITDEELETCAAEYQKSVMNALVRLGYISRSVADELIRCSRWKVDGDNMMLIMENAPVAKRSGLLSRFRTFAEF